MKSAKRPMPEPDISEDLTREIRADVLELLMLDANREADIYERATDAVKKAPIVRSKTPVPWAVLPK